jgi:hypothetical protein
MKSKKEPASRSERRSYPRYTCTGVQKIARLVDGHIPARDAFESVQCADISRSGFSFLRPAPPQWDALVVALGDAPHRVFLIAKVVNTEKVIQGGQEVYRVGCRFTGRVKPNETQSEST